MSIALHPEARRQLISLLAEELPKIRIRHNIFPIFDSMVGLSRLDEVLPNIGSQLRRQLNAYISENPLWVFLTDQIELEFSQHTYEQDDSEREITYFEGYKDTNDAAERLISRFETLPWKYSVFISLPRSIKSIFRLAMGSIKYPLSDTLRLFAPEGETEFPSLDRQRNWAIQRDWVYYDAPNGLSNEELYLNGIVEGYVPEYRTTTPLNNFYSFVRAFCGLGIAELLLQGDASIFRSESPKKYVLVYRETSNGWEYQVPREVPTELRFGLAGIAISDVIKEYDNKQKADLIRNYLVKIRTILQNSTSHNSIFRAAQWFFDSYSGENQLLAFIQTMIALEILLGDKEQSDLVGLTTLLANRCAYLIGKSKEERDEIIRDFKQIYKTRSNIVHRGEVKLTQTEASDLSKLRWLCMRVLQEEIRLIMADKSADKPEDTTSF